jgi:hypothetical protein
VILAQSEQTVAVEGNHYLSADSQTAPSACHVPQSSRGQGRRLGAVPGGTGAKRRTLMPTSSRLLATVRGGSRSVPKKPFSVPPLSDTGPEEHDSQQRPQLNEFRLHPDPSVIHKGD